MPSLSDGPSRELYFILFLACHIERVSNVSSQVGSDRAPNTRSRCRPFVSPWWLQLYKCNTGPEVPRSFCTERKVHVYKQQQQATWQPPHILFSKLLTVPPPGAAINPTTNWERRLESVRHRKHPIQFVRTASPHAAKEKQEEGEEAQKAQSSKQGTNRYRNQVCPIVFFLVRRCTNRCERGSIGASCSSAGACFAATGAAPTHPILAISNWKTGLFWLQSDVQLLLFKKYRQELDIWEENDTWDRHSLWIDHKIVYH